MSCVLLASLSCAGFSVSTVRRSCEQPDKISSGCSKSAAGDCVRPQLDSRYQEDLPTEEMARICGSRPAEICENGARV